MTTEAHNPAIPHCDQCQMLNINGLNCHETGCRNSKKTWDPDREQWIRYFKCRECGDEIEEGESCNCNDPEPDEDCCNDPRCVLSYNHAGPCQEEEED